MLSRLALVPRTQVLKRFCTGFPPPPPEDYGFGGFEAPNSKEGHNPWDSENRWEGGNRFAGRSNYNDNMPNSSFRRDSFDQRGGSRFGGNIQGENLVNINWENESPLEMKKDIYVKTADISAEDTTAYMKAHEITIAGAAPIPTPINEFSQMAATVGEKATQYLTELYQAPSAIQATAWPIASSGRDLIAISQTGSGKTLGYLLPGGAHLAAQQKLKSTYDAKTPVVLVMAPTRELVQQIETEAEKFSDYLTEEGMYLSSCYGGVSRGPQRAAIQRGCEVLVATPGRLLDFLESGVVSLKTVSYLVIDEADRMLDMGFEPALRKIVGQIRPDRQTVMFSATWPREVQALARDFCREEPVRITVGGSDLQANKSITQEVIMCSDLEKREKFMSFLEDERANHKGFRVLVFTETRRAADALSRDLRARNFEASAIHGDKEQSERDRVLYQFKNSEDDHTVLVATDVAQRGIDVSNVSHVINYDPPKTIHDYIHRIGRTGRAGKSGRSITFLCNDYPAPDRVRLAKEIAKVITDVGQTPSEELVRFGRS